MCKLQWFSTFRISLFLLNLHGMFSRLAKSFGCVIFNIIIYINLWIPWIQGKKADGKNTGCVPFRIKIQTNILQTVVEKINE